MAVKTIMLLSIVLTTCVLTQGEVYKVGGSSGWTNQGNPDYKSWAASINFGVGDTLQFTYNKEFHNVLRVTHKNYNACNSTAPIATWATGNDSFPIRKPGHYYFICGVPGHCESGQKVDIRIMKGSPSRPSPPSPWGPSPSPTGPDADSPSPSLPPSSLSPSPSPSSNHKKSGSVSLDPSFKLWALVVALSILAIAF